MKRFVTGVTAVAVVLVAACSSASTTATPPLTEPMSNTTTAPATSTPITPPGMTVVIDGRHPAFRAHMAGPLSPDVAERAGVAISEAGFRQGFRLGVSVDYTNSWLVISVQTEMPPDPERLPELEALIAAAPGVTRVERLP